MYHKQEKDEKRKSRDNQWFTPFNERFSFKQFRQRVHCLFPEQNRGLEKQMKENEKRKHKPRYTL
jgi:hypothetical protein